MKLLLTACLWMLIFAAPASAQWTVVEVESSGPKDHPDALQTDLWLKIELRNDSDETLYVPGLGGSWYMIESYIKDAEGNVWERQNVGVDRELEMTAVAPGATINAGGRYSRKHVGRLMMLTFMVAHSEHDHRGSRILVGPFEIPAPSEAKAKEKEEKPDAERKGDLTTDGS